MLFALFLKYRGFWVLLAPCMTSDARHDLRVHHHVHHHALRDVLRGVLHGVLHGGRHDDEVHHEGHGDDESHRVRQTSRQRKDHEARCGVVRHVQNVVAVVHEEQSAEQRIVDVALVVAVAWDKRLLIVQAVAAAGSSWVQQQQGRV